MTPTPEQNCQFAFNPETGVRRGQIGSPLDSVQQGEIVVDARRSVAVQIWNALSGQPTRMCHEAPASAFGVNNLEYMDRPTLPLPQNQEQMNALVTQLSREASAIVFDIPRAASSVNVAA